MRAGRPRLSTIAIAATITCGSVAFVALAAFVIVLAQSTGVTR